jgi:hypothetical protein
MPFYPRVASFTLHNAEPANYQRLPTGLKCHKTPTQYKYAHHQQKGSSVHARAVYTGRLNFLPWMTLDVPLAC